VGSKEKSPDAFRTISEVAIWLDTPAHVLRFWESRFPEIAPVKGAGGRRYYRPDDMRLLGGIKQLLHQDGHTIKAVQEQLASDGVASVTACSPDLPSAGPQAPPLDIGPSPSDAAEPAAQAVRPPIGYFFDDSAPSDTATLPSRAEDAPAKPAEPVAAPAPVTPALPSIDAVAADPDDPSPSAALMLSGLPCAADLRGCDPQAPELAAHGPDLEQVSNRLRALLSRFA
jgi:DNA-binding transcriptional MerR regulator